MIHRIALTDILDNLPALLVSCVSVNADEACAVADNCSIDCTELGSTDVRIYVRSGKICYRLHFNGCTRDLISVQQLMRVVTRNGAELRWFFV